MQVKAASQQALLVLCTSKRSQPRQLIFFHLQMILIARPIWLFIPDAGQLRFGSSCTLPEHGRLRRGKTYPHTEKVTAVAQHR